MKMIVVRDELYYNSTSSLKAFQKIWLKELKFWSRLFLSWWKRQKVTKRWNFGTFKCKISFIFLNCPKIFLHFTTQIFPLSNFASIKFQHCLFSRGNHFFARFFFFLSFFYFDSSSVIRIFIEWPKTFKRQMFKVYIYMNKK